MQDSIINAYNNAIANLESQKNIITQNIENEIIQEKRQKDSDVISPKFNDIDNTFNDLSNKLRAETETKIQEYRNQAIKAKEDFKNKVYADVEAQVKQKNSLAIQQIDTELSFIHNRINGEKN